MRYLPVAKCDNMYLCHKMYSLSTPLHAHSCSCIKYSAYHKPRSLLSVLREQHHTAVYCEANSLHGSPRVLCSFPVHVYFSSLYRFLVASTLQFIRSIDPALCAFCVGGSFKCECLIGYMFSPTNSSVCVDRDECQDNSGQCQQLCQNFGERFIIIVPFWDITAYASGLGLNNMHGRV